MAAQTSEDLLSVFDRAPLTARYWASYVLLALVYVLDFFDFFLIAFIMAVIGPRWHLTYGHAALVLYGSGIGAILGSLIWGALADRFGRKMQTVTGTLICGLAGGAIGFLPDGAYVPLAVLRILVGFGLAAAITPALTIVVELTPTRWRSGLTSLFVASASVGLLLASFTSHALLRVLGWRGVAMLGLLPILIGVLAWLYLPESVRWLAAKGRIEAARNEAAKYVGAAIDRVPLRAAKPSAEPRASLAELYADPQLFWQTILLWGGSTTAAFGALLWGPTIVSLVLHISVAQAAQYYLYVTGCAIVGRVLVSFIAQKIGRRLLGIVCGFAAAVFLAVAGYFNIVLVGGFPLFVILLAAASFFVDAGLSNLAPYSIEQYGVRMGARSSGLGHAAAGIGKILGPLTLAVIAGSGNFVSPKATGAAVLPAFLFLSFCMLLVGLAFLLLGRETHGRAMTLSAEAEAD
ncbi:MAG TPA: MFS transporter [Stellaceae bacterium]